jgi:hypothetical protein
MLGTRKSALFVAIAIALATTGCVPSPWNDGRVFTNAYYVSPSGSDTAAGTAAAPWKTFAKAFTVLTAGDVLVLRDGIYHESLKPPTSLSGKDTLPITFGAEHDGKALINGDGTRIPIYLRGNDYIEVDGVVAYNSSAGVVAVESNGSDLATHDTFRRVSAYNTAAQCPIIDATTSPPKRDVNSSVCNHQVWEISGADHTLVEDCVAAGRSRSIFYAFQSSYTTVRRCWFRGDHGTGWHNDSYDDHGGYTSYQATHTVFENVILADPIPTNEGSAHGIHDWNNVYGGPKTQVNVDNRYYGNVVGSIYENAMGIGATQCKLSRDHVWQNDVVVQSEKLSGAWRRGLVVRGGNNLKFDHLTLIGDSTTSTDTKQQGFWANASVYSDQDYDCSPLDASGHHYGAWGFFKDSSGATPIQHPGYDFTMELKNSAIQGFRVGMEAETNNSTPPVITNHNNNVQGNGTNYLGSATAGAGNTSVALAWDTATYGKGAYFVGASNAPIGDDGTKIGARVLYEYKDGVITGTHLWPFPMEDRIWNETGDTRLWEGANATLFKAYQQSATWDGATVSGQVRTGGWWKTLTGVYP